MLDHQKNAVWVPPADVVYVYHFYTCYKDLGYAENTKLAGNSQQLQLAGSMLGMALMFFKHDGYA